MFNNTLNPYSGFPEFEALYNQEFRQAMDLRENADAVSAEYRADVLTITLPKTEKDKDVRKIK